MKILILADSRAMWPREFNWPLALQQAIGPDHQIHTLVSGVDKWLISIYGMEEHLLDTFPNEVFDLIIVQAGWHEGGGCYWPKDVWEGIVNTKYRKFDDSKLAKKLDHKGKEFYLYVDRDAEKSVFETFKKHSKKCVLLGMQSLRPGNDLDKEYNLGLRHHYDVLEANKHFSEYCDYLDLPMDDRWVNFHCLPDRIHYNYNGAKCLAGMITKYINSSFHTISSILSSSETHKSLYQKACKVGTKIALETKINDVVLISIPESDKIAEVFLACILQKRIPLVIQHPSHKIDEKQFDIKMREIKEKANPSLCICSLEHSEKFRNTLGLKVLVDISPVEGIDFGNIESDASDVAFLQLSSGTTGSVKIFEVTHEKLIRNCYEYGLQTGINGESSIVSWLPLYHDMGLVACFLLPIIFNIKTHFINPFDWLLSPASLLKEIDAQKATHVWMPNFAFNYLQRLPDEDVKDYSLASISHLISCSEPTHFDYLTSFYRRFQKQGLKENTLFNCYALAENVFAVSQSSGLRTIESGGTVFMSCGRPIQGVSVLIMDESDNDLNERNVGRVMIKSGTMASKQTNKYGYYDTGDLGFIESGEIFIVSRAKDSFVSFGNNIYPHLVELSLVDSEIIPGRLACFPVFENGSNKIGIIVESNSLNLDSIKSRICQTVRNMFDCSPEVFVERPGFLIKTSSGKISRSRSGNKALLKKRLVELVSNFLASKNKPKLLSSDDALLSSGLLDSLEIMEMVLMLEKNGMPLNKESLTKNSFKIDLDKIDSIDSILENLSEQ